MVALGALGALGALLVVIGFVFAIPRGPGSISSRDLRAGQVHAWGFRGGRNDDQQGPRKTLVNVLIGLGVMALGGLCIAFGS